jgi:hypothetical protein
MTHASRKTQVRSRTARCARHLANWLGDRSGGALIFSALALPVILGAAALAFDVSSWYTTKRHIQTVADASAMAAMHVRAGGGAVADATAAARVHAQQRLSFLDDAKRDIDVDWNDPADPANAGVESFEVTITQRRESLFSSVFMDDSQEVVAGATAANQVQGESCVLSLDTTGSSSLKVTGGAQVNASCGFASNSSSATSINVDGTSSLSADEILTYGEIGDADETRINSGDTSNTTEHFFRLDDPYADLELPVFTNCSDDGSPPKNVIPGDDITVSGGTYCKSWFINGGILRMDPGVYYFYGNSNFTVNDGTVEGDGVTIIFGGANKTTIGIFKVTGGTVTLTAPDANGQTDINHLGKYAGILLFTDPEAAAGDGASFAGTATVSLNGVIYMPSRDVTFAGDSGAAPDGCLQIVANAVTFAGDSSLDNTTAACQALGLVEIGERRIRLTI